MYHTNCNHISESPLLVLPSGRCMEPIMLSASTISFESLPQTRSEYLNDPYALVVATGFASSCPDRRRSRLEQNPRVACR
jgi:hypothetical protein